MYFVDWLETIWISWWIFFSKFCLCKITNLKFSWWQLKSAKGMLLWQEKFMIFARSLNKNGNISEKLARYAPFASWCAPEIGCIVNRRSKATCPLCLLSQPSIICPPDWLYRLAKVGICKFRNCKKDHWWEYI